MKHRKVLDGFSGSYLKERLRCGTMYTYTTIYMIQFEKWVWHLCKVKKENPTGWVDNKIWNITCPTKGVMVGQGGKNPLRSLNCGFDIAFRELSFKRKRQMFLEKLFSFIRSFYVFSYPTIALILTLFPYPQCRMKSDILLLKRKAQRFISLEWGKAVTCK